MLIAVIFLLIANIINIYNCIASLRLCKLFEDLLQESEPSLFFYLIRFEVSPLTIGFPWIVSGFVGYLAVDQVLHVWDRIIGHDSLLILPILAAAIIAFRKQVIMVWYTMSDR